MADENRVVFDNVAEHFTGNVFESCFMSNQYRSIKIVASGSKNKTEKNCDDCRASVTILIGGNCFGNEGTFIFLSIGNTVESKNCH